MKDAHCTRCHADLRTKDGTSSYERKIDDFTGRHPEFAVQVTEGDRAVRVRLDDKARLKDTAQVKLNHQKHLKVGLRGLDDLAKQGAKGLVEAQKGLQLSCTFCHRPDAQQAYMAPVTYKDHCAVCHPLGFDAEKFPDAVAPTTSRRSFTRTCARSTSKLRKERRAPSSTRARRRKRRKRTRPSRVGGSAAAMNPRRKSRGPGVASAAGGTSPKKGSTQGLQGGRVLSVSEQARAGMQALPHGHRRRKAPRGGADVHSRAVAPPQPLRSRRSPPARMHGVPQGVAEHGDDGRAHAVDRYLPRVPPRRRRARGLCRVSPLS